MAAFVWSKEAWPHPRTKYLCDVAVARVLLGYFQGTPMERIPDIEIAPGLIELVRGHSGFSLEQHRVTTGKPSLLAT